MPAADHPILVSVPLIEPQVMRNVGLIKRRGRTLTPAAMELEQLVREMPLAQRGTESRPGGLHFSLRLG